MCNDTFAALPHISVAPCVHKDSSKMVNGIHHINFIVRDLDAGVARFERLLGRTVDRRDTLDARGVLTARFRLGEVWLVIVQPTREGTEPARFLATHGEGFFLLSFAVDSLDDVEGIGPVRRGLDDWQVADFDPADTYGVLCQVTQTGGT